MWPPLLQIVDRVVERWLALPPWLSLVSILILGVVVGYVVEKAAIKLLQAWAKRTTSEYDDAIVKAVHPALSIVVIVALVWLGLHALPASSDAATIDIVDRAGFGLVVLALAVALVRLVGGLFQIGAKRRPRLTPVATTGSRLAAILIYIVGFLVVLENYDVDVTPLIASLGIGALAVGLALQDTLANFFAGLWIQAQPTLQPGHFVRVEDQKVDGFVERVGWRTTRMRTLPGNIVEVPNARMAQSTIQDFMLPEAKMGTSLTVVTGFEADPERVVPMLLEECAAAAEEVSFIVREPTAAARLNRTVENGWEFWVGFWVAHYYDQWNAQGHVLNRIRRRFLREGIRIPYPIREMAPVPEDRADRGGAVTAPGGPAEGAGTDRAPRTAVGKNVVRPDGGTRIEPAK